MDGFDLPDLVGILDDGAVGGEFTHACNVDDGLANPFQRLLIKFIDLVLRVHVAAEIRQQAIDVSVFQKRFNYGIKDARLSFAEVIALDHVDYLPQFRISIVITAGIVARLFEIDHFLCRHAEDEHVLSADLFRHFDISAIQSADGQSSI